MKVERDIYYRGRERQEGCIGMEECLVVRVNRGRMGGSEEIRVQGRVRLRLGHLLCREIVEDVKVNGRDI
jgi:hypothetical protein